MSYYRKEIMIGNLTVIEYWNKAKEISSENHIQVEVPAIEELLDVIFNGLTITFTNENELSDITEIRGFLKNKEYRVLINYKYDHLTPNLFLGAVIL